MDIELRNVSEGTAVALLAEAANKLQGEIDDLKLDIECLNKNIESLNGDNKKLHEKNRDLDSSVQKKDSEIKNLNKDIESLKGENQALHEKNRDLDSSVQKKDSEIKNLNMNIESLKKENDEINKKEKELKEENQKKEKLLKEVQVQLDTSNLELSKMQLMRLEDALEKSLESVEENSFADFIKGIKEGVYNTIQRDSVEDIKYDLKLSSGWLANLASLYWWGNEERVSPYLPEPLRKGTNLIDTFDKFLSYLPKIDYNVNIPSCGFSDNIDKYKTDNDVTSETFKKLFPKFKSDNAILCQISILSYNDKMGKCINFC